MHRIIVGTHWLGPLLLWTFVHPELPAWGEKNSGPSNSSGSAAQTMPFGANPEALQSIVAQKLLALTGHPCRIGHLAYDLLTSSITARDIELGPRKLPFLRMSRLTARLALLGTNRAGIPLRQLTIEEPRLELSHAWMTRPLSTAIVQPFHIDSAKVSEGKVALCFNRHHQLVIQGLRFEIKDLDVKQFSAGNGKPAISGSFKLHAERIEGLGISYQQLVIKGRLVGHQLRIKTLTATEGADGEISLRGRVGLRPGHRLGPFALSGSISGLLLGTKGPPLAGRVRLRGADLNQLLIAVVLAPKAGRRATLAQQQGGDPTAPESIQLRGHIGRRNLTGTLRSWRLR